MINLKAFEADYDSSESFDSIVIEMHKKSAPYLV